MMTKTRSFRNTAVVFILLLFALSGCGKTYPIHDYEIDREKHPGWYTYDDNDYFEYLNVHFSGKNSSSGRDPVEKATYLIFESSAAAKSYFNWCLDDCKEAGVEIYDKGWGWFISDVPHTYDAEITRMYYLDRNVIICADVYMTTYSTLGDSSSYDNSDMKKYILDNHGEMREFVMGLFS